MQYLVTIHIIQRNIMIPCILCQLRQNILDNDANATDGNNVKETPKGGAHTSSKFLFGKDRGL